MQKCYNCGKEVDDNVLICPDCGALVKRYGRPESAQPEQEADPFPRETAFDTQPHPRGAVWRQEDGKLKFSGYVTFWLVLCAIYLGNLLLSFAITLLVYRFRDFYFEILGQFEELAYMEEYLRQLMSIIEAEPIRLIVVGVLVAVQFGCVIWFLVSKRKLAFFPSAPLCSVSAPPFASSTPLCPFAALYAMERSFASSALCPPRRKL